MSAGSIPDWRGTAGALKTQMYRKPRDLVRRAVGWGAWNFLNARRWEREMRAAAEALPAQQLPVKEFPVAFLTGAAFWHQTAFCAWSFCHHAGVIPDLLFVDDGSLTETGRHVLQRLFPSAHFQESSETLDQLDHVLPWGRFPALRRKWENYPNIRKLTDIHSGRSGWRLALDSDMLFFSRPEKILAWMDAPTGGLFLQDMRSAYGYPRPLLDHLAGGPLPEALNVGLCGLRSESIDWDQLEQWTAELVADFGDSYLLEQGIVAMLMAKNPFQILPRSEYLVAPTFDEVRRPEATLHHYVDWTRPLLFRQGWRSALARCASPETPLQP